MSPGADAADRLRRELRAWLAEHWTEDRRAVLGRSEGLGEADDAFAAHREWNAELVDAG